VGGSPGPEFVGMAGVEQLCGMMYDLTPLGVAAPPPLGGTTIIEYGALGRNPLPVTFVDPRLGGVIEMYLDSGEGMSNFNGMAPDPWALGYAGPKAWDERDLLGQNLCKPYARRDTFPTVNTDSETSFLQLAFIPSPGAGIEGSGASPGALLRETLANFGGNETGVGSGFAMVVGGSYAHMILPGGRNAAYAASGYNVPAGLSADLEIRFNIDPTETSAPPWGAGSDDPVKFSVRMLGDANDDGVVDELDVTAMAANWQEHGGWAEGDFNGDGFISQLDLTVLAIAWPEGHGAPLDVSAVPEPATLTLLALLALSLPKRRGLA